MGKGDAELKEIILEDYISKSRLAYIRSIELGALKV